MAVQPAATLSPIPEFPALSDRAAGTYNSKAYAFGTHMGAPGPFVDEINAMAANVHANAEAAEAAGGSAGEAVAAATEQAGQANESRLAAQEAAADAGEQAGIAGSAAGIATTKRDEAVAAAGQAVPAAAAAIAARDAAQAARDQAQVFATQQIKATSTTSVTPAAGNKAFTIEPSRSFVAGMYLVATSAGVPGTRMSGYVVSYDMATGQLVIAVDSYAGAAARADWLIGVAAPGGGAGAGLLTVQRITANTAGVANVHYVIGAAGIRLTIPSSMATDDRIAVSEDITPGLSYEIDFGTVPLRGFQNGLTQVISNRAAVAWRNVGGTTGLI